MNLKYDTKWIAEKLPPIERVWRRSEPDSYGASYLIAEQTERKKPPVSFAHWRHGWNYLNPIIHPRLLGGDPGLVHLMTTAEQVQIQQELDKVAESFTENPTLAGMSEVLGVEITDLGRVILKLKYMRKDRIWGKG